MPRKILPPIQLHPRFEDYPEMRFILVGKNDPPDLKAPTEKRWQTDRNYAFGHSILMNRLKHGRNFGIICRPHSVVDIDDIPRLRAMGVMDALPATFVDETGSGGEHWYLIVTGIPGKVVMYDREGNHLGEILHGNFFVVGPGSLHPNGRRYTVKEDRQFATITWEELKKLLEERGVILSYKDNDQKKKTVARDGIKQTQYERRENQLNDAVRIEDIAWPDHARERRGRNGREIYGEHPVHGARNAKDRGRSTNFHINIDKNTWYCHACDSGGGWMQWLAVREGFIRCDQAGTGCLQGIWPKVLQRAVELGLIGENLVEAPIEEIDFGDITYIDGPLEHPPKGQITVHTGAPRTYKTDNAMGWMIEAGSARYLSHTHATCEHAFRAFKRRGGRGGVHVQGKGREGLCRKGQGNCKTCELSTTGMGEDYTRYSEFERRARRLLRERGNLDAIDIPTDMCPYQTLLKAAEEAPFVFTVPAMLKEDMPHRKLLVVDEDTTLSSFFAPAVELFRYKLNAGENKKDKKPLEEACTQAKKIKEMIERRGGRKLAADSVLLSCFTVLDDLKATIGGMLDGSINIEECKNRLKERLVSAAETSCSEDEKEAALQRLDEYMKELPIKVEMETDLSDYVACLLYLYKDWPLLLTKAGRNGYETGTMIADQSKPCLNMKWIRAGVEEGNKVVFIGSTLARIFAGALTDEPMFMEAKGFRYAENYAIIPVDGDGEDSRDGRAKIIQRKKERLLHKMVGSPNQRERHPTLVVVGSKQKQVELNNRLRGLCNCATIEDEEGIEWFYATGLITTYYLNSLMSRGLDVPMFHLLVVHSCDFSIPYWAAPKIPKS